MKQKSNEFAREFCKQCILKNDCDGLCTTILCREDAFIHGLIEGLKTVDLELIHIINDIIKYHDDEETKKDEYETAVLKLARYWEKLGKIELAEWTLAQIGVNAWTPQ